MRPRLSFLTALVLLFALLTAASAFAVEHGAPGAAQDTAQSQTGEHTQQSQPGVFSGSIADAVWTIIWFIVLMLVLGKFAWKPILQGLQSREDYIRRQIEQAEETKQKAQETLAEYHARLAKADQEGQKIIDGKIAQAQKQAEEMKKNMQQELDQMRIRAEADLERARHQAQEQLKVEASKLVFDLGRQILARELNNDDNHKLIDQAIDKLRREEQSNTN